MTDELSSQAGNSITEAVMDAAVGLGLVHATRNASGVARACSNAGTAFGLGPDVAQAFVASDRRVIGYYHDPACIQPCARHLPGQLARHRAAVAC